MPLMEKEEREYYMSLFARAGIDDTERFEHPEHGFMINETGVRKLVRIAPDRALAARKLEDFENLFERLNARRKGDP